MLNKIKELLEQKKYKYLIYSFMGIFLILLILFINNIFPLTEYIGQFNYQIEKFLAETEIKTLDLRFNLPNRNIKANNNIVILSIDDDSLDNLENDYGKYPWSRDIYAKAINYLEADGVDSIAFDLMFKDFQKGFEDKDKELINSIIKNKNVYVSMSLDKRTPDNPPDLPNALKYKLENHSSNVQFENFTNCNLIFKDIIKY